MKRFIMATTVVVLMTAITPVRAAETDTVAGNVIVARARGNALVLWDCTPRLIDLVKAKTSNDEILRHLESEAIAALYQKRELLRRDATSATVRVIYSRTGDISPIYGTPTFAGTERLMTLTVSIRDLLTRNSALQRGLASGNVPKDVSVTVIGKLPPQ